MSIGRVEERWYFRQRPLTKRRMEKPLAGDEKIPRAEETDDEDMEWIVLKTNTPAMKILGTSI